MIKRKIENVVDVDDLLNDAYGLFKVLSDNTTYPLLTGIVTATNYNILDVDYLLNHSYKKYLSGIANLFYDKSNEDIASTLTSIAVILYQRFGDKWKKIWDAMTTAYNPLENYSMTEKETIDYTRTPNITTDSGSNGDVSAFNEDTFNPSTKTTTKTTETGTDRNAGSKDTTRSGNIGVTTSQQMLESEIEIRQKNFYTMMYNDIDSILCLKTY